MVSTITSPVQLCNLALSQIAARAQIQNLNDGTAAGDACGLLYQPTIDAYARAALWNCLRFQTGALNSTQPPPLQLLKAAPGTPEAIANAALTAPPQPWLYEYELPTDCLRARFLIPLLAQSSLVPPLTTAGGLMLPAVLPGAAIPFTVAVDLDAQGNEQQVLLTNLGSAAGGSVGGAQLVYTRRLTNIGLWDSQFTMGAKAALAVWLAPALNGSVSLANAAMGIAKAMLDSARISDGNEGPQTMNREASWITARSGRAPDGLAGGWSCAQWDAFSFPGGLTY